METVYLVEDCHNAPGRIYAVFSTGKEAVVYSDRLADRCIETTVVPHKLHYEQPEID